MRHFRTAGTVDLSRFEDRQWPINKASLRAMDAVSTLTWWADWAVNFTGRHGFKRFICGTDFTYGNRYSFVERATAEAWEEYMEHLKYHNTLDAMVRERMEAS
jgi:hypothetical protein